MRLLKRFVCGQCGATGPVDSPAPYLRCESCSAVGDFDWGAARRHPEWPAHESMTHELLQRNHHALEQARIDANRKGWTSIYEAILYALVAKFPALYPPRSHERDYLARFIGFYTAYQMTMAIEPPLLDGQLELDGLHARVKYQDKVAHPETVWPLVDAATRYFAVQEQLGYAAPPPEDFAPRYVYRSAVSAFVADWLPKLSLKVQRELVTRLGVSVEYLAPQGNKDATEHDVTCRNCGGTVRLADDVERSACPYCGADMHAAHEGQAARGEGLAMIAEAEQALDAVIRRAKAAHGSVERIEILDGPVVRKGKPYRLVALRACSPARVELMWTMYDVPDSLKLVEILGWLDVVARERGIPLRKLGYREHARCTEPAKRADELAARLAEAVPHRSKADVTLTAYGRGVAAEVLDGDTVVRVALAADGGAPMGEIKKWLKG